MCTIETNRVFVRSLEWVRVGLLRASPKLIEKGHIDTVRNVDVRYKLHILKAVATSAKNKNKNKASILKDGLLVDSWLVVICRY